jgi:hypothetical protein
MTAEEVEAATNQDETLKGVRVAIKLNKWHYDVVEPFKAIKEELTVTSKGVYSPSRIADSNAKISTATSR